MSVSVTMPRLGESVSEGTVTRWLKAEGDHVDADEPLLEVSPTRSTPRSRRRPAGVLTRIKVAEDETVDVGIELAVIDDGADACGRLPRRAGCSCRAPPRRAAAAAEPARCSAVRRSPPASAAPPSAPAAPPPTPPPAPPPPLRRLPPPPRAPSRRR